MVGLGVKDLKASTLFYETHFGWTKTRSSNDDITFFQLNGILLSLYNREKLAEDATVDPNGSGFKGVTLAYNTRSEEEVDDIIKRLSDAGVTIVKQPEKVFWGGYSSYIADPDGHLWEIAFNPFLPLDEDGNVVD
ncbi:MAG: VOC family protein [Saprospiraceae bacterium]|nr:VOC family protein [Saprospiraceae bacterium]